MLVPRYRHVIVHCFFPRCGHRSNGGRFNRSKESVLRDAIVRSEPVET